MSRTCYRLSYSFRTKIDPTGFNAGQQLDSARMSAPLGIKISPTMDQLHLEATGEHLSPIPGDMCPHPVEYYIAKTKDKQVRRALYKEYYDKMRKGGSGTLVRAPPPTSGEQPHLHTEDYRVIPPHEMAMMRQDIIGCPMDLIAHDGSMVYQLWPDGREHLPPTPACSAPTSPALNLKLPAWAMRSRVSSPAPLSPIVGLEMEEGATAAAPAPVSRLRTGFTTMLKKMPLDALYAELTEWTEEQARAAEHVAAIEEEITSRG